MTKGYKKIGKTDLNKFINDLIKEYRVFAPTKARSPVNADSVYTFTEIQEAKEASLDYTQTMIPPKQYFFPTKETLLKNVDSLPKVPELNGEFVLLGVHACDINSFLILDEMFAHGDHSDPFYERRREHGIVIGVDCEPTENCFCKSMGVAKAEEGFDLFFTQIPNEEGYIVTISSKKGEQLASTDSFLPVDTTFAEEIIEQSLEWEEKMSVETDHLSGDTFRAFDDDSIWEELGDRCLACGNCTMVCPCCNCFDVKDETSLQSQEVKRTRTWNACTLLEFAEVAGGNFRSSTQARYRNWFYDKFRIFPREIDEFGCVGCGRCVTYCPVEIDPRKVILEVREKHER